MRTSARSKPRKISVRRVPAVAAQRIQESAVYWHRVELAIHAVGFIALAVLFVMALSALGTANVGTCAIHDNLNQNRGLVLAAVTVGGAVIGRLAGWFRFQVLEGQHPNRPDARPHLLLNLALIAFLAAAALLLGYETWAIANGGSPPPITSYVRCAAYHQFFVSSVLAGGVGFILSNWLWFPSK